MFRHRTICWLILISFLVMLPPIFYGAKLAWDRQANRVQDWLPASFSETQDLFWFVQRFGGDELLMISWDGCHLSDPRVARLADELAKPVEYQGRPTTWFRQILDGPQVIERLTREPLNLTRLQARKRLQGWLVGHDNQTTCLVAFVSADGAANRAAAVEHVWSTAEAVIGQPRREIHIAGPTCDSVAIDSASKSSLLQFNVFSWLICLALLWLCLRSIRLAWQVFFVAFSAEQLSLAIMHYSGAHLDSTLLLVANLTFVLGIASGVHLVNYLFDAVRQCGSMPESVVCAVKMALRPCLLAAGTTSLGMISLTISQLTPVRSFGFFAAVSVLAGVVLLLTVLPSLIVLFPPRLGKHRRRLIPSSPWRTPAHIIVSSRGRILLVAGFVLAVGVGGLCQLRTSVGLHELFWPEANILQDYDWLESHIGYLVPIEIVFRWPEIPPENGGRKQSDELLRRLRIVDQIRSRIQTINGVGAVITPTDFTPPLPPVAGGLRQVVARQVFARRLLTQKDELAETGFYANLDGEDLWRVSVRVSAKQDINYGHLMDQVGDEVDALISHENTPPQPVVCGGVPLVYKTQSQLLLDLAASFATALAMIAIVMIIVQRSLISGLLTMIPNVLPTAIVFGFMGWLGKEVEIGGMLTASAALGIAVDDSLHYITRLTAARRAGQSGRESIESAFQDCGIAMTQTTLVCTLGLIVFACSQFIPIARFAWLMFTLLLLALVCDLGVLPAILVGSEPTSNDRMKKNSPKVTP